MPEGCVANSWFMLLVELADALPFEEYEMPGVRYSGEADAEDGVFMATGVVASSFGRSCWGLAMALSFASARNATC